MVPSSGGLYLAPFTDAALWSETMMKARFWEQTNFYGVDLSPLQWDAKEESFMMPVVGYFDPNSLVATPNTPYIVDFTTITMEELFEFEIPFSWTCSYTGIIHGISSWFDIHFNPPSGTPNAVNISMSTGPFAERTHWQQVRFLLKEPLAVNAGQNVVGTMKFKVNEMRSYDLTSVMVLVQPGQAPTESGIVREGAWSLHEQTYNYTYAGPTAGDVYPETNGMYVPEQELKQTVQVGLQNPVNGTFELNSATTSTTNN
jgi:histone-arginine methyltransferase CARM1